MEDSLRDEGKQTSTNLGTKPRVLLSDRYEPRSEEQWSVPQGF